jgi:uncharacterized protein YdcH (DUF465 family)
MVLDNFYEFIEDQVEILMTEEKVAWDNIITEAAAKEANERLEQWLSDNFHTFMAADLRNWALPTATKEHLSAEKNRLEDEISRLVNSRKQLEADVSLKKKNITEKRKVLQAIQGERKKINTPVSAEIDSILLQYNSSAAAYHGGKLNGFNCCELICLSKQNFPLFEAYLLAM